MKDTENRPIFQNYFQEIDYYILFLPEIKVMKKNGGFQELSPLLKWYFHFFSPERKFLYRKDFLSAISFLYCSPLSQPSLLPPRSARLLSSKAPPKGKWKNLQLNLQSLRQDFEFDLNIHAEVKILKSDQTFVALKLLIV